MKRKFFIKILVKTTGAFIIPLGRGEFVLPEASEVEDCALLQSEIRNGRVEFVKAEDSVEPAAEVEAEPVVEVESEPVVEVESEPVVEPQPVRRGKRNR